MKIIIGLGNPGRPYQDTRHNIGWIAVSALAKRNEAQRFVEEARFYAECASIKHSREKIILVHPLTYMNASGTAVAKLRQFYRLPLDHLLIVHDEMDFAFGRFAFAIKGNAAGHHGVSSVLDILQIKEIPRLRIGISRPVPQQRMDEYVLEPFDSEETHTIPDLLEHLCLAMEDWITFGLSKAMNTWNTK